MTTEEKIKLKYYEETLKSRHYQDKLQCFQNIQKLRKKLCAEEIVYYMVIEGTQKTLSGNYHFEFDDINKRFNVNLPADNELLEEIVENFDYDIVAEVDITEDFDLMFWLGCCPNVEEVM